MSSSSSSAFLDNYDSLDVIGNGSFGIIRKVRRKSDGLLFARKELNFERMTERDRKQIVAEVNILKDLHHDHIVRYHDRYVDRDAGILYILMEYCGGGDLSTVIKQASRSGRLIPEDMIWSYFFQILHALQHCHHPNGHARSSSGNSTGTYDTVGQGGGGRRPQILHRDLKPDNVFLDEENKVKLGDFGLSKALAQASFANTYVGTPYYMSPELMQEKAYDSKSDIWSLGCLIYELCALKPPFHEAKTHSELSIFIRNGRIPPLPRGYSQALTLVIKSMLNLNPAMRPSAAQLLQHERLELVSKVQETEKMLAAVKLHRATVTAKEREVASREAALLDTQNRLQSLLSERDSQIATLQHHLALQQQQAQSSSSSSYSHADVQAAVKAAVSAREVELRELVMAREAEVAKAIALREEEIMEAVRAREAEVDAACVAREQELAAAFEARAAEMEARWGEVEERVRWVLEREEELGKREEETRRREDAVSKDEARVEEVKRAIEEKEREGAKRAAAKGRKDKNPLEEVKNVLQSQATPTQAQQQRARRVPAPATQPSQVAPAQAGTTQPQSSEQPAHAHAPASTTNSKPFPNLQPAVPHHAVLATPIGARAPPPGWAPMSAMKGVVLTATGETLATPAPGDLARRLAAVAGAGAHAHSHAQQTPLAMALATPRPSPVELGKLFEKSPRVGLNFARIFDFEEGKGTGEGASGTVGAKAKEEGEEEEDMPPSPSVRTGPGPGKGMERSRSAMERSKSAMDKSKTRREERERDDASASETSSGSTGGAAGSLAPPPTRIRRPSIRTSGRSTNGKSASSSEAQQPAAPTTKPQPQPLPHPHLRPSKSSTSLRTVAAAASGSMNVDSRNSSPPEYDLADEENLPSPFLRRGERADRGITLKSATAVSGTNFGADASDAHSNAASGSSSNADSATGPTAHATSTTSSTTTTATKVKRRPSSGLLLRAVAAANSAGRRTGLSPVLPESDQEREGAEGAAAGGSSGGGLDTTRLSLVSARKASEEARKALLRP